jgi:hypothetical protein
MDYWKMFPIVCMFACSFNTFMLHIVTDMMSIGGCPKNILVVGSDADIEASSSLSACSPDVHPLDFFLLRCLRSMVYGTGVDNSEELWH